MSELNRYRKELQELKEAQQMLAHLDHDQEAVQQRAREIRDANRRNQHYLGLLVVALCVVVIAIIHIIFD